MKETNNNLTTIINFKLNKINSFYSTIDNAIILKLRDLFDMQLDNISSLEYVEAYNKHIDELITLLNIKKIPEV